MLQGSTVRKGHLLSVEAQMAETDNSNPEEMFMEPDIQNAIPLQNRAF